VVEARHSFRIPVTESLKLGKGRQVGSVSLLNGGHDLVLARNGDVVLRPSQRLHERCLAFMILLQALILIAEDNEERGAALPLDGVNHVFCGEDAPIVLAENGLGGTPQGEEARKAPDQDDNHQDEGDPVAYEDLLAECPGGGHVPSSKSSGLSTAGPPSRIGRAEVVARMLSQTSVDTTPNGTAANAEGQITLTFVRVQTVRRKG
jgi:hypothetical protein